MEKRIVAIIGSEKNRQNSNTVALADLLINKIGNLYPEISAEVIVLGEKSIFFCKSCMTCNKTGHCCINDDMSAVVDKMQNADVVILGSPVHIAHVSGMYKNFLDRLFMYMHTFEFLGKPFVSLVTTNGSGEEEALKYMNHTALLLGMIHQGSLARLHSEPFCPEKANKIAHRVAGLLSGEKRLKPALRNSLYFWSMKRIIRNNLSFFEFENLIWQSRGWYETSYRKILAKYLQGN